MGDAEVIARRRVLPRQHDVAEPGGVGEDGALAFLLEGQAGDRSAGHVQAERIAVPASRGGPFGLRQARGRCRDTAAAIRAVRRAARRSRRAGCRRGSRSTDTAAPSPADFQDRGILGQMFGLHPDLAVPIEAKPREVLQDRGGEFRTAADRVDVFQPQQEPPPAVRARRHAINAENA